jgi:hypothetical protein
MSCGTKSASNWNCVSDSNSQSGKSGSMTARLWQG